MHVTNSENTRLSFKVVTGATWPDIAETLDLQNDYRLWYNPDKIGWAKDMKIDDEDDWEKFTGLMEEQGRMEVEVSIENGEITEPGQS